MSKSKKSKMSKEEKAVRDALAAVQADAKKNTVQTKTPHVSDYGAFSELPSYIAKPNPVSSQQEVATPAQEIFKSVPAPTISITATPPSPEIINVGLSSTTPAIKTATPDIVLFNEEDVDIDEVFDLIFENLSGQELINISRSDIINGQKISYQPIKNLSSIQQRYNSNNIVSLQQTADKYFAGFSIKLEDKVPNEGNGENGENIYVDEITGDLIIELVNLNNDEQIETEITLSGTIYEINLGDYTS
jgi:hypothetical protein